MQMTGATFRKNADFIRRFFRETPTATVRDAVRAASRAGQGLHWAEVSRIHREILPELRPVRPTAPEASPPAEVSLAEARPEETPPQGAPPQGETVPRRKTKVPLLEISAEEQLRGGMKRGAGTEIRRRYLNAYLDKYPEAPDSQCREALFATFGHALMTAYIQETIRLARAARNAPPVVAPVLAESPPPPAQTQPEAPPLPSPAPAAASPGAPLEEALRALAASLKQLCASHGLEGASLSVGVSGVVRAEFSRTTRSHMQF